MPQGTQGRVEAIKARARRRSIVHVAQLHGVVTAQSAARCAADRTRAALSTNAVAAQGLTGGGGGGGGSAMLVPGSDASATAGAAADVAGPEPGRLQVHNLPMSRNAPSPRPRGCVHAGRAAIANVATLKAPVVPTGTGLRFPGTGSGARAHRRGGLWRRRRPGPQGAMIILFTILDCVHRIGRRRAGLYQS